MSSSSFKINASHPFAAPVGAQPKGPSDKNCVSEDFFEVFTNEAPPKKHVGGNFIHTTNAQPDHY